MASSSTTVHPFPVHGILPKEETQAASFLSDHPQYDGKGVVVAILDTGVDPGAAGLQVLPDGCPKIIDIIDCSGSGDVDTSTVIDKAGEDGSIEGLTGRKLRLNPEWKNPTGKWHVGVKRAFELYPNGLKPRVKGERKKEWTLKHRKVEAELQRQVTAWKVAHPKPSTTEEIEELADMEARVSQLNDFSKNFDDPGPLYDVVVWHTGEIWEAAVDVSEEGDLSTCKAMADYHVRRDWRTFNSKLDNLNFSVNIYEEGNVVSITVDAGSHGTHVAGITAAYHPDNKELNGLAPGAQIVSLKIGDSRLGSMETGVAVIRALSEVVRLKCDMINMSYGEAVAVNQTGRVMKHIEEVVNKYGVIYVGSASNNGPALSTVGAPGGSGTSTIAAGAYLSTSMMMAEYSLRKTFGGINFTWSSVGPSYDGEQGPTIVAPGGAIASVPNWTMQKSMLMNGTSMAAPNACGSIALVLSALKAQSLPYTPHLIRRAITTTAKMMPSIHPLVQGHGMVQVTAALAYATRFHSAPYVNLPLAVHVAGAKSGRGVYLREPGESAVSRDFKVTVDPKFHEDAPSEEKVKFEARIALSLSSTNAGDAPSWVVIPSFFLIVNGGRGFNITVDGSRLPPGLHFTKVLGHDVDNPDLGSLFEVPITVVKPIEVGRQEDPRRLSLGTKSFSSGEVQRHFIVPPPGTTWLDITLTDKRPEAHKGESKVGGEGEEGEDGSIIIVALQTVQLLPQTPFRDAEFEKYVQLAPGQKETFSVLVEAGITVEVATAQYAIAEGTITIDIDVECRGILPKPNEVILQGGYGFTSVALEAKVRDEELSVSAKLDKWQTKIVPSSSTIKPLGSRDVLPDGRQIYQLILEYKINCTEAEEIKCLAKLLNGYLYESPFEAQFFIIFDANKKYLGCGDAWPDSIKCSKGENVVRMSVRHDELSLLQGLQGLVLVLERALKSSKEVSVPEYATREEAMIRKNKGKGVKVLRKGCMTSIYLAEPSTEKLPKGVKPGDLLVGSISFVKGNKEQARSKRPKGFVLTYVVPPPAESTKSPIKPSPLDERSEEEKLAEKVRDLKIQHLGSVSEALVFEKMYEALLVEYKDHIPLLQARLRFLDDEKGRLEQLKAIVAATDAVIGLIDTKEVALHFGVNVDEEDPKAVKVNEEMEAKKTALADALARKARALIDLKGQGGVEKEGDEGESSNKATNGGKEEEEGDGEFSAVLTELAKWDSIDEEKYARLVLERDERRGRLGNVMKLINKLIEDPSNQGGINKEDLYKRRLALFEKLEWEHLKENDDKWRVIDCPKSYALF